VSKKSLNEKAPPPPNLLSNITLLTAAESSLFYSEMLSAGKRGELYFGENCGHDFPIIFPSLAHSQQAWIKINSFLFPAVVKTFEK